MASDRVAIIAQALADVDIQIGVARESIEIQISNMQAKHGPHWTKEWRRYRLSITKRLYNLFERRHVLTLLRDFPERTFFGQTEIVGVINAKGKMIKRFKGWKKHFRIADWSEWAGTDSRPIAQLGDVKTSKAIKDSVKQLKTGKVKGSFRPGSTVKEQLNKERYAIRRAKALGGRLLLRVQDVLTLKYHTRIIDPKDLRLGAYVPYGHKPDFLLPRPITRPPKLPTSQTGKPTARGKQKATNSVQPTIYAGGTPDNAKVPKGKKTRGKGKGKLPLEPTTYTPGRGTDSSTPTTKERGTDTPTKPAQKNSNIVTITSHGNKFKIKFSAKYPKTAAVLKIGGGLLFDMALSTIGGMIRASVQQKAAGIKFAKVFEQEATQKAIEEVLIKEERLKSVEDVAYYIQLQIKEIWLGSYDKTGDVVQGLETPYSYAFHEVLYASTESEKTCKRLGFSTPNNAPEGVNYKHQICSYPIMINKDGVEAFKFKSAFDSCVNTQIKLNKPSGAITQEDIEVAERTCMKKFGGRPIS